MQSRYLNVYENGSDYASREFFCDSPCPSSIGILESSLFNWSKTGDVHESPVPAAAAHKHTVDKEI